MIGPPRKKNNAARLAGLLAAACLAAIAAACGTDYFEIPIETPIQPKLDVSAFQRVLVIGFVAGGTDDVDANQETVRLLRSQLRTKSGLRVIDADILPLIDVAREQNREQNQPAIDEASAPREGNAGPCVSAGPGVSRDAGVRRGVRATCRVAVRLRR